MLLHACVQIALDQTAVVVGRQNEPLAGGAQRRGLEAQLFKRLPQRVDVPSFQGIDLPIVVQGSCPSSQRRRQAVQHTA
jgi:hypothetical protein